MSGLEDKLFIGAVDGFLIIVGIIGICRWRAVAGLSTFFPMTRATIIIVIVGDVRKLATETLHFSLCGVLFDFVTTANLKSRSHDVS